MSSSARACPSCTTPLPDEAHFCMHCGSATPPDVGVPPRTMPTGAVEVAKVRRSLGDRFRVERILGEGGMATVYLAEDLKHHRRVAVKVMRPELAATLGAERFLREVEIAAQLSHPHILPMHDSGEADGLLYYVMPYVEGETLQARLAREKQLPVADAVRIAREVAEALHYAHRRGIVHRDIKPANILLSEGHATVADFGIARALSGDGQALTRTGLAVGTPHYMSPEQATGGEVDGRTDVYALGAVLYEMLAGEPPFTGPSAQVVMSRSLTEDARPVSSTRAGLPAGLQAVVTTALAKHAADRHATAGAMASALQAVAEGSVPTPVAGAPASGAVATTGEAPRGRRLTGPGVLAAAGLVVAAALLGAGALWGTRGGGAAAAADGIHVAILPFEHQGDSSDAYFADGIADEVRGKLTQVEGLRVIASASTRQYRGSTRPLPEIARELNADYVLTGRVRWVGSGDARRVQVVPELVNGRTGNLEWQQAYNAALSDVFDVQTRIATQVSAELGRQLGAQEQQALAERPTQSVAAWELYQKARALTSRDPQPQRQATAYLEQAVVLDTAFADAWAELATSTGFVYYNGNRDAVAAARSREALAMARRLAPDAASTNTAAMLYHVLVEPDSAAARAAAQRALRAAPRDAVVLARAAVIDRDAGDLDAALTKLALARELDPRSVTTVNLLSETYLQRRRFDEAAEAAATSVALAPGDPAMLQQRAVVEIARGDLPAARAVVRQGIGPALTGPQVAARFAGVFEMAWVLEPREQALLARLTPAAFDDDREWWAQAMATAAWQRGDTALARAYADSELAAAGPNPSQEPQLRALRAVMLAYRQRHAEARREAEAAVAGAQASSTQERDYVFEQAVHVHLVSGDRDLALARLEELLRRPYHVTPAWLRLDPAYASLRGDPRFERLAGGK